MTMRMTVMAAVAASLVVATCPASAQIAPQPSGGVTSGGGASLNMTPEQQARQAKVESERQACRQQAVAQGVQGEAVRQAVMACMGQVDPMAARRMACMQQGRAKGLQGPEAMRPYVQACMRGQA